MFEPNSASRVFAVPLGADFPVELVNGFLRRAEGMAPHDIARTEIFLSTRRMERRVRSLFEQGEPCLLPRLRLITDLAVSPGLSDLPQPDLALAQRLELRQLVKKLLAAKPDLAPQSSAFDLADSLATLMEEMHGEGVSPAAFSLIDPDSHSEHWRRSLSFLQLIESFFDSSRRPSVEARQRSVVDALIQNWETHPPQHPIIIAGSTGSRGTTARLMRAVSRLPQGAVILPGVDTEMPRSVTEVLATAGAAEEHPQYRLAQFADSVGKALDQLDLWSAEPPLVEDRVKLVALALRPAPVTDAWLAEGPALKNLDQAVAGLTLIEAESEREEALAIALSLRKALADGVSAALITPDRNLSRRVSAAMQAWRIEPDDSGGVPLQHTPAGRLVKQCADLLGKSPKPEELLALLKHPMVQQANRGEHLLQTRRCELSLLRGGPRDITPERLRDWAAEQTKQPADPAWVDWLDNALGAVASAQADSLENWVDRHIDCVERLAGDSGASDDEVLWQTKDGAEVLRVLARLREVSHAAGAVTRDDYLQILGASLAQEEFRDPLAPHPDVMIWGTLEARVQGADLVILAGLNEGVWPETPSPDPWLNRAMRAEMGLFLPERQIGLSAHDFQQGILAPKVILTRTKRDAEAETVASRWLNRLVNLMSGLPETGKPALQDMRNRGREILELVHDYSTPAVPIAPADRPSPCPPAAARPAVLYVTGIERLIRDPYAIYARYILNLRPLDPLVAEPSATLRGQVFHSVLERFVKEIATEKTMPDLNRLLAIADKILEQDVTWDATRAAWRAKFAKMADWFLQSEERRLSRARPALFEDTGSHAIDQLGFTLKGRADRIDISPDGAAYIYDYKTGELPTKKQLDYFNKQVPLLAAIAAFGGFQKLGKPTIAGAGFIGLGASPKEAVTPYSDDEIAEIWADLESLIEAYQKPDKGYSARRAVFESRWDQDYDHLARYGEWDETDWPTHTEVGQ